MKKQLTILLFVILFVALAATFVSAASTVNFGTAGNFVILAKTGISTTGTTLIVGDIGVSPAAATFITGFDLIADSSNTFSTSSLLTGKIYAADYTPPTPTKMTTAVSDMETAYTDAAGRAPDVTELGAGNIGGRTLAPGVYKWGTGLLIPTDVTLSGSSTDIWIFQIAGTLDIASATSVKLAGGAQARNIFWIVADSTTLGTTSVFNGNIIDLKEIVLNTGATLNGRALSQTAVTLDANAVSLPAASVVIITPTPTPTPPAPQTNSSISSTQHVNASVDVQIGTNSSNNDSNGIGQELNLQIAEKRTEYKSGNFTTSLGKFLNVRAIVGGMLELREGNVIVKTKLNLTKVENNGSKLEVELSNGKHSEIKIMPSTASAIAIARLGIKVCNISNNCIIELKTVGSGNNTKVEYQLKAQKNVKVLGLFRAKMNVEANVDAKTGEIISINKPWWARFAVEGEQ